MSCAQCPSCKRVVIGVAGSAAATLLALGDYAIAYPEALIHFHGVRLIEAEDLTMEAARDFAAYLRRKNDAIAMRLVESISQRLVLHYDRFREEFGKIQKEQGQPGVELSDVECFICCLKKRISGTAANIVDKSLNRWKDIKELSHTVFSKLNKLQFAGQAEFEAAIIREIVKFEIKRNRGTNWTIDTPGIAKIVEDYTILRDYYTGEHNRYLDRIVTYFGPTFLKPNEYEEIVKIKDKSEEEQKAWIQEKVAQRIKPFVYFVASLCRYLQEEENPLTARDAYWLGAVDEVFGTKLPCMRLFDENKPKANTEIKKTASTSSTSGPVPPSSQSPPSGGTTGTPP